MTRGRLPARAAAAPARPGRPGAGLLHGRATSAWTTQLHYVAEQDDVPTAQGLPVRRHDRAGPTSDPADLVVVPGWRSHGFPANGRLSAAARGRLRGPPRRRRHRGQRLLRRRRARPGRPARRAPLHHPPRCCRTAGPRYPARQGRQATSCSSSTTGSITSAGIASGIDLALHLVATRHGPGRRRADRPRDGRLRPAQRRRTAGQRDAPAPRPTCPTSCTASRTSSTPASPTACRCADLASAAGVSERTLTRALRRRDRPDPAALPAAAAARTRRTPHRPRRHRRGGRPRGRLRGRPHAAPPPRPPLTLRGRSWVPVSIRAHRRYEQRPGSQRPHPRCSTADGMQGDRRESNPNHQGHNLECTSGTPRTPCISFLRTRGGTRTPNILFVGQALFH